MRINFLKSALIFFFFCFLSLTLPVAVKAATFSLDPVNKEVKKGDEFQVKIILDTQSKKVNAVEATIVFSKDLLELKTPSFTNLFPLNSQSVDNNNGKAVFDSAETAGGVYYQGSGEWLTLTFTAQQNGTANLNFSCSDSRILELETTQNLLGCSGLSVGAYTISDSGGGGGEPTPTSAAPGPACTSSSPSAPTNINAVSGPNNGEVTLRWNKSSSTTHYGVVFGPSSKNYQYGAANIGNTDVYVVKSLVPGQLYYFAVVAVNNCAPSGFSPEASARAKGATGTGLLKPTPTIYVPIEEILPEIEPTVSAAPFVEEIIPTPEPTVAPGFFEQIGFGRILLIAAGLLFLLLFLILIFGRKKQPPSPPTPQTPPASPNQGGLVTPPQEINEEPLNQS